ncbi:prolyl endopeptidase-like [Hibiscus syriacus]|uniref:Prolyl endopeptidase-like n=1 Tax=Hibiscus syriacus TaxID=106335 RepID=A0A6A2WKI3_HIBSY|nr:prolyl endopeptidase-like [Hibiscus syriacus]
MIPMELRHFLRLRHLGVHLSDWKRSGGSHFQRFPPLSEDSRKRLQQCRECTHQILKAATAINRNVLAEMEIPNAYSKACPSFCAYLETQILEKALAACKVEKARGGKVQGFAGDIEKTKVLAERAETLLQNLRLRFPGLRQTSLDMIKIQHNKDLGQSILESYSRVMESLAFNIAERIDDLLYVDDATEKRAIAAAESISVYEPGRFDVGLPKQWRISANPLSFQRPTIRMK